MKALLAVTIIFCCIIGYKLSTESASITAMVIFLVAAVASLQFSYVAGLIFIALSPP